MLILLREKFSFLVAKIQIKWLETLGYFDKNQVNLAEEQIPFPVNVILIVLGYLAYHLDPCPDKILINSEIDEDKN